MNKSTVLIWGSNLLGQTLAITTADNDSIKVVAIHVQRDTLACAAKLEQIGIAVLKNADEAIKQQVDCVVITELPQEAQSTLLTLLEQGRHVICTVPQGQFLPNEALIQEACRKGNSAFHQTTLFPQMLSERLTMTLCKGLERVEHVRIIQSMDVGKVDTALWGGMEALGLNGTNKGLNDQLKQRAPCALAIANNIARQLYGADQDEVRIESSQTAHTAPKALTLPFGNIKRGRVARCTYQHDAWLGDHRFLTLEEHWHPGGDEADWGDDIPFGNVSSPCAFTVQINGHPGSFDSQLQVNNLHADSNPLLAISVQEVFNLIPALAEGNTGALYNDATPRYQLDSRMPFGGKAKGISSQPLRPLRVVIWGPGEIGGAVIRGALQRSHIQLVGAKVFTPHKHGKDLGELAGIAPIGVKATRSKAEIIALKPDCVIVTPQPRAITEGLDNDVIELLEAGINVISSAAYHNVTMPNWLGQSQTPTALLNAVVNTVGMGQNPAEDLLFAVNSAVTPRLTNGPLGKLISPVLDTLLDGQVRKAMPYRATPEQLQAACQRGNSTLHGTGVHPTFMAERVGMQLAAMIHKPRHVRFIEAADFSFMPDGMWGGVGSLGFGRPVEQLNENFLIAKAGDFYYGDVIGNAAHLMYGVPCSQVRVQRHFWGLPARRDFQVGSLRIRKNHAAALHMVHKGFIGDHHFFTNEECWYLGPECEFRGLDLPFGNFQTPLSYTIQANGEKQSVDMQLSMGATGKAAQMMAKADLLTADGRCQLGQDYREAGVTNPITNATAMAILEALPAIIAMPPGVVIDDTSVGLLSL